MSGFKLFAVLKSSDVPNVPTGSANDVLNAGLNLVYFVAGIAAVIVIIVSAITLVTNNGEPETLKKARNTIMYAVIGLVVIMAAFALTWFFIGRIK
jgi:cytochrome c biogenesis protein CcdA